MPCQLITDDAVASTVNAALLRETLAYIEANPAEWNQLTYSKCFAKHAARLAGGLSVVGGHGALLQAEDDEPYIEARDGSRVVQVHARAQRALGLDNDQAYALFDGINGLDVLREQVADLISLVHHVTIRIVPEDVIQLGEVLPGGRAPLEVMEHRPGDQPMFHGGERGMAAKRLRAHARVVAARLGVPYIDPVDPAAMERLTRAEAA
ncbi:hypothetical protein ACU635_51120 [[Actinomadura] parvosata]|uniref:hypothetical protein n=1 Tax=[Actinomadura] parvosata TaxID=1955412 RepID=UPI00406D1F8E